LFWILSKINQADYHEKWNFFRDIFIRRSLYSTYWQRRWEPKNELDLPNPSRNLQKNETINYDSSKEMLKLSPISNSTFETTISEGIAREAT